MTVDLVLPLVALALVDTTSFGTLGVPLYLLLASDRPPVTRLLIYLATVAAFYFIVGVALMLGLTAILDILGDALESRTAYWTQLVVGVGLFLLSFRFDPKRRKKKGKPERIWEPRLGGPRTMVLLALTATGLEVATMVPYLAAIGILTTSGMPAAQWLPVLAGYTLIMILPMVVILAARNAARGWLDPKLERLSAWMMKHSTETVGWVLAIAGFMLAANAVGTLFAGRFS